jgi:hypothetical protein
MTELLGRGCVLRFFQQPVPKGGDPERVSLYCRAPCFIIMEWAKPLPTIG